MIYNVHGGHSLICRGASAILDEVNEDRKIKNAVINYLRQQGHTVYDCTDDVGKSQDDNLSAIVAKCNSHSVDLDISIHLNSGRNDYAGDGSTGGVEVYGFDNNVSDIGGKICEEISSALGIRNRGFKISTELYVLKRTHSKAILIECCFVDDKDDAVRWDADKCAKAIVKGITGVDNINENNSKGYTIVGESNKMFSFETKAETIVRVAPNSLADAVTKLPIGSKQGITKITANGWGYIGNGAGWLNLKDCKPLDNTTYQLRNSHCYVRESGTDSHIVTDLKKGSRQSICFVSNDNRGYISNYAGWVRLKFFKKI